MAKTVYHIGPIHDDGGMAAVIDSISSMDIEGWTSLRLNSYNRNPFWSRFSLVPTVLNKLSTSLKKQNLDAVHIHVTHGMSWFRKHFFIRMVHQKECTSDTPHTLRKTPRSHQESYEASRQN